MKTNDKVRAGKIGGLAVGLCLATLLAVHPVSGQTLTIGYGGAVNSLDPHYYNGTPNFALAMHVFDGLVSRDVNAQVQPGLAESWRRVSDTEWEFTLRDGVLWHDGARLVAEDVAATYARVPNVPNSPSSVAGYLRMVSRVEVVDARTLRIHTPNFYPNLPTDLAALGIVPRRIAQTATTEDFNTGRAMIGTGPYRFVSYRPKEQMELARNDQYWGGREPWQRVVLREITNPAARTAGLLSGDLDVIDQVSSADLMRLGQDTRVRVVQVPGLRLLYMQPTLSRTGEEPFITDNDGKPIPRNPLQDLRVRQALSMAIDRAALEQRVMDGVGRATMQWLPPGLPGYVPDLQPQPADPAGARRLLAEAGFPNGFRMTVHTPNDRYPNDSKLALAVAQMWTRIGVQTQVEALPWSNFAGRSGRQELSMFLIGWGSSTGEPLNFLTNVASTYNRELRTGNGNDGRYSNPEIDAMVQRVSSEPDDMKRMELAHQATRAVVADLPVIPLVQVVNYWATRNTLRYTPRMDERTTAMQVRPAN